MITQRIAWLIGELARPLAIIATSFSASWAVVVVAYRVDNGNDGALVVAAGLAGAGAFYIGKAVEVFKTSKSADQVEIARVTTAAPPVAERSLEDPA